jgi:hypothetical protein
MQTQYFQRFKSESYFNTQNSKENILIDNPYLTKKTFVPMIYNFTPM